MLNFPLYIQTDAGFYLHLDLVRVLFFVFMVLFFLAEMIYFTFRARKREVSTDD